MKANAIRRMCMTIVAVAMAAGVMAQTNGGNEAGQPAGDSYTGDVITYIIRARMAARGSS